MKQPNAELQLWQRHHIVNFLLQNESQGKLCDVAKYFKEELGVRTTSERYGRYAFKSLLDDKVVEFHQKGFYKLNRENWLKRQESTVTPIMEEKKVGKPKKKEYKEHAQNATNFLEALQRELEKIPQPEGIQKLLRKASTILSNGRDLEAREILN